MTIRGENVLVLAPMHDTGGKKDATCAFQPEARAFAKRHGVPKTQVVLVDNHLSKPAMRKAVLAAIEAVKAANGGLEALAFLCHGWKTGLQFGFDRAHVDLLAAAIAEVESVRVPLFACSTGRGEGGGDSEAIGGDNGFADLLRDALCRAGAVDCQVDAHTTAGHTTKNPNVRRFLGMGSKVGGVGGFFIVSPAQKALFSKWRWALKDTALRYDFPFLSVGEIHAALLG